MAVVHFLGKVFNFSKDFTEEQIADVLQKSSTDAVTQAAPVEPNAPTVAKAPEPELLPVEMRAYELLVQILLHHPLKKLAFYIRTYLSLIYHIDAV